VLPERAPLPAPHMSAPAAPRSTAFEDRLRALSGLLSPLVPLVAALVLWAPIRDNYFRTDDFVHLYDVVTRDAPGLLTQIWGGHLIAIPNMVLAALFPAFGPDPRPYFCLMLLTHAANVLLLHHVIWRFTGNLAFVVSAEDWEEAQERGGRIAALVVRP
jgi:hypothetical protein